MLNTAGRSSELNIGKRSLNFATWIVDDLGKNHCGEIVGENETN